MKLALIYLIFHLPGLLVAPAFGLGRSRFVFGVSLSIMLAIFAVLVAKLLNFNAANVYWVWLLGANLMLLFAIGLSLHRGGRWWWAFKFGWSVETLPALVVGLATAGYTLTVGPYLEIPSDAIWHLGRIQDTYEWIVDERTLRLYKLDEIFHKSNAYWYLVQSQIAWFSGLTPEQATAWLSVCHSVVLNLAVFFFARVIFQSIGQSTWKSTLMALAATAFFVLHFGLGVFSFVRYYTFGPVFLNYVVYLAAMLAVLRYLESEKWVSLWLVFLPLALFTTALVHKQEALFILGMGLAMLLVVAYRLVRGHGPECRTLRVKQISLVIAGSVAYLGAHGYLYTSAVRHDPLAHGVMTDIGNLIPFLDNLYVLKPDYQFFQVMTVWGIFVYVIYLLYLRKSLTNLYLSAGMLIPVVTFFNPLFTDLFLRVSWPEVLWRLGFVIPIHLVGGFALVQALDDVRTAAMTRKISAVGVVVLLVILLLPADTTFYRNDYAKLEMLKPVKAGNDARAWGELFEQLRQLPKSRVLSDPVTGYAVNAYTSHIYPGHKFSGRGLLSMGNQSYEPSDFARYRTWLLVINMRDGYHSMTGQLGRHWSENVMRTRLFYQGSLKQYVESDPAMFEPLWSNGEQRIYRIHRK